MNRGKELKMALGDMWLGPDSENLTLLSPLGRKFTISNMLLVVEEQVASGRMCQDVIAKKEVFTLLYEMIDGDDLETFLDFYDELDTLYFRWEYILATYRDRDVRMEPIPRERILIFDDGLWGNVEIILTEE